jgi:hypothetical protein
MKLLLLFLLSSLIFQQPIQAATPIETQNNKVEEITDKLKEIVKGTSTETLISDQPKSFFGSITQITDNQITINCQNQNQVLQLNDDTAFINSKRQNTKVSEFKVGETILAMGYLNLDKSLNCHRMVATDSKDVENNNQIVTGQIVDVPQSQNLIFAFTPFQNKDTQYQIKLDSKTKINNTENKQLKSSEVIVKGKKVIIVMHPDTKNNQTFYATKIINLESNSPTPTPEP